MFEHIKPGFIRIGQLVEVQFSLFAIAARSGREDQKYTMMLKMRSICILSRAVEDVSNHLHNIHLP